MHPILKKMNSMKKTPVGECAGRCFVLGRDRVMTAHIHNIALFNREGEVFWLETMAACRAVW